jgi:cell division protein FtsN
VGVYSKPVKAGQLFNITPLYFELNQKGQYRYTSGIFNEVKEAAKAKNIIVQIGVADAFVSAYLNGKRIPMEQAAALEAQEGKSVFAQVPGVNVQPKIIPFASNNEQRTVNNPETKTTATANNKAANIVYKVQLGAFKNEVPVEIMNKYLTIADKGIANFKSGALTIYTVGNYKEASAAEAVKLEVIAMGITDAFVIALNNGEKISLEEAKKLGGN